MKPKRFRPTIADTSAVMDHSGRARGTLEHRGPGSKIEHQPWTGASEMSKGETNARRGAAGGTAAAGLGSNAEIGRRLKQYYDEIVSEDVPDRFAELLKQLEETEQKSATAKGA